MAAALFNAAADPGRARAISAGTNPATHVHPEVLRTMEELGLDLHGATPKFLTDELARGADLLVTMGCGDQCPVVFGLRRADWPLDDPAGQPPDVVRRIREDIRARVAALVAAEGWGT